MTQEVFIVYAEIIDANGVYHIMDNYPKAYKSTLYDNDIEKTKQRALGDYFDIMGDFGKRDDRQIQDAFVKQVSDGAIIASYQFGKLPILPDQELEVEE